MTTNRTLCVSVAFFTMTLAGGAMAQTPPASVAPAASMPTAGASMPHDCAKPIARHDHGVEKGVYAAKTRQAPCAATADTAATPAQAASTPAKRLKHDHTQFR